MTNRITYWRLQALGWMAFYVLVLAARLPFTLSRVDWRNNTIAFVFMFLGSCALRPICRSVLDKSSSLTSFTLRAFGASAIVGALARLMLSLMLLAHRGTLDLEEWSRGTLQFTVVLFLWCILYHVIHTRERLALAERDARDARLAALRYQLNPHFLFNALNAVSTLVVESNTAAATRMLARISDFLRDTLDSEIKLEVPLSDEIALTGRYLAIEQIRLAERLQVKIDVAPEAWDAAVPSLVLQPLIENAVRHGIAPLVEGGTLGIHCSVRDAELRLTVRNSGPRGQSRVERSGGIGLPNLAARLSTLYGDNHRFALAWPDAGGCEATVHIPFRRAEARCAS